MQRDANQTQVHEPRDDSGGYTSSPQPQQPPGSYNTGQGGQDGSYQQYGQPYSQSSQQQYWQQQQQYWQQQQQQQYWQQQQQYWQQQPYSAPPCCDVGPHELTSLGMRARTAGWLSYLLFWVTGLIFFLLEKENRFVRFHAMQSILFFGGLSILEGIIRFFEMLFSYSLIPIIGFGAISSVVGLFSFVCWIILMVRASQGVYYKLPVIGNYAEKIANQLRL
jgi:uncharacterized membrane protein